MASFTVPNRRTSHWSLQPADAWRSDEWPAHTIPGNNLELDQRPRGGRTKAAARVTPVVRWRPYSLTGFAAKTLSPCSLTSDRATR
jgi:hypothetical protein